MIITLLLTKRQDHRVSRSQQQLSAIDLYKYAQLLSINGLIDPPCKQTQNIYVCAGYCPWTNTRNNELVSCSFLPRKTNPDFINYNIYCTPDPDQCPNYNAWLKDSLPLTLQHIKQIPDDLLSNFTLNYTIPVNYGSQEFRAGDTLPAKWTVDLIENYRKKVRAQEAYGSYGNKDIYPALDKYASLAIINKKCAVIGTENPWIEAALLEYNASSVTTIEYATIHSSTPRLFTITPMDFAQQQQKNKGQRQLFDSVWSYSSIEHDGLSRYRDPLNPYGDFQTMIKITCILKPGGFLFLSVPLNVQDLIQFNLHRLYGSIRLPLLYRNFHVVEMLGTAMERTRGSTAAQQLPPTLYPPSSLYRDTKYIGRFIDDTSLKYVENEFKRWVKSKPWKSIVYIAFSSICILNKVRIKNLIYDLTRFLLRKDSISVLFVIRNTNYENYQIVLNEMKHYQYRQVLMDDQRVKVESSFLKQKWLLQQNSVSVLISHCGMG
ncbi:unnamed protein product [Rotaria sp. Silwood2]|nr:unnamed protein product [Rotaria sp. Silwood2]